MVECRRFQNESHKHNFYGTYFALLSLTLRHCLAFTHPGDIFVIEEIIRKLSRNIFLNCFLHVFCVLFGHLVMKYMFSRPCYAYSS